MDDPACDPRELERGFADLEAVNRWLGGHAASLAGLARLLPADGVEREVLDVGCGGGDTARAIADWARATGRRVRVLGVDLSPVAIERARARAGEREELEFRVADLHALPESRRYDAVHAALLLHHIPGEQAARALAKMFALARGGVVINDLHRHPAAYYAISAIMKVSGGALTKHDAPLSVLRAFRREELERLAQSAGLPRPELRWRWAFRWELLLRR